MSPVPKILNEFSITNDGKKTLQAFMESHIDQLANNDKETRKALKNVLADILPEEVIVELRKMFQGKSEYAVLIKNLPEADIDARCASSTYSFHIGSALYELCDVRSVTAAMAVRDSHKKSTEKNSEGDSKMNDQERPVGYELHRDSLVGSDGIPARYIIFSAPYNGEHAATKVVDVCAAIQSLPEDVRAQLFVEVIDRKADAEIRALRNNREAQNRVETFGCTLEELLGELQHPVVSKRFVKNMLPLSDTHSDAYKQLQKAMRKHTAKVDLQPGDLLVVDEERLFHRASLGDDGHIRNIPKERNYSRILLHNAGSPADRTP